MNTATAVIRAMFSRRWALTTLLVLAGAALCVRLGIWQLDRLEHRREFNAHLTEMWSLPPVDLNSEADLSLVSMEYRSVRVTGVYDFDNQVALYNQYHEGELGYHLLTPLRLPDGRAVIVDRGWIPAGTISGAQDWHDFDEPATASIDGTLRLGQARAEIGGVSDPTLRPEESGLQIWHQVNLDRMAEQLPYPILEVYVQPDPDPGDHVPPIPYQPLIELSEGPHLGYAGQWFVFAAMLFFGYPLVYLRKQVEQL
jgi:surfeit locus 1 family protein